MRVAVDARELCGRPTGVGRYLSELLTEWSASDAASRHEWTLYTHAPIDGRDGGGKPLGLPWSNRLDILPGNGGTAWEQVTLARALNRDNPHVLFAPGYTSPLMTSVPVVQTIHDVSFFAHPEWFSAREGFRRRAITRWSAAQARIVLTDSKFSEVEINKFIGPRDLRVIPLGIREVRLKPDPTNPIVGSGGHVVGSGFTQTSDPLTGSGFSQTSDPLTGSGFSQTSDPLVGSGFSRTSDPLVGSGFSRTNDPRVGSGFSRTSREPLVLYVGSVFDRRRVDLLINTFDRIVDSVPAARLEIVGENRTTTPRVDLEALRAATRHPASISIRSYVDDQTLQDLYDRASVFVFLSEYEGFGLTPLEALRAGVPPVVLDTAVAREVCGPAARYVPVAGTAASLVATVTDLLTSEHARDAVLAHRAEVLSRYDWAVTAAATLAALEEGAAHGR